MAGSLTLGGMADGLLIGGLDIGPSTMTGKRAIGQTTSIEMLPGIDFVVPVPPEAVAFAVVFTFTGGEGSVVNVRTDINETDIGFPIPAQGWFALPIAPGVAHLKFKAAAPPSVFQLTFI